MFHHEVSLLGKEFCDVFQIFDELMANGLLQMKMVPGSYHKTW
jgi:hypothetical protein